MQYLGNGFDHRWGERIGVDIPVRVSAAAATSADGCVMKNLSLSGAFMHSKCEFPLHALIEVRIDLPPPASRPAVLKAHVSRNLKEGVGIEWCEFAPQVIKEVLRDWDHGSGRKSK